MIDALSFGEKFWPILALDHGLTVGHGDSVSTIKLPAHLLQLSEKSSAITSSYGDEKRAWHYVYVFLYEKDISMLKHFSL